MFEFKMSYKEAGFHKPGDRPFTFPPENVSSKLDANLIEIEGGNGTGKTTLLNCLALALGYLDEGKELEHKVGLQRKLENLDSNLTLSYCFRICYGKPELTDLKMERKEGQEERIWLNSKQTDLDHLRNDFDVVFLTEDDPKKVVNASLGKLAEYFKTIDGRLLSLNNAIYSSLRKIKESKDFKREKKELEEEIKECEQKFKTSKTDYDELQQILEKVRQRDDIKIKLELLADEKSITSQYESLKASYEELTEKEAPELLRKLTREKINLDNINLEIKDVEGQITRICTSLKLHGTILDSRKIIANDYTEYNRLLKKLSELKEKAAKMQMVDDMIELFERYERDEILPLIDKPVHEALSALIQIKGTLGDDRVFGLMNSLETVIERRKSALQEFEKIQDKIADLSRKLKNLKSFENIQKSFSEAQTKFLELQNVLHQDKIKMATQWSSLSLVKGDAETIAGKIQELEVQLQSGERIKSRCGEKLRLLIESATGEPKFENYEKELQDLYETTIRLRENAAQWIRILETPTDKRKKTASSRDTGGFRVSDHNKFVKAVGEFLGTQFEPVDYNYQLHDIKFFDIERNVFITKEDRQIPIDELSQGQSKISVLRKVFKEMNPSKKKIVLIDEIADLDAANMQFVRDTLKSKLYEGSLLLAVLVRPRHGISPNLVEIKGWA